MKTPTRIRTVLIVDGSHIVLTLARDALERAGYRVLTHQNPTGCLTRIILDKPDLVLIDVSMPALSGETIVKLLGSAKPKSEAIVLLHSNLHDGELRDRVRASGADGYIQKSSNQDALVREVDKWMARRRTSYNATGPATSSVPSANLPAIKPSHSEDSSAADLAASAPGQEDSEPRFSREVRITEEASPPNAPEALGEQSQSGVRRVLPTVLFVDDEMLTLSTYRRSFQHDAFVSEFSLSGNQALTRINSACPPSVVVCDVMMQNTDGVTLFAQAVAIDPSWRRRIVFVTGAVGAGALRLSLDHFEGSILKKPVAVDELRRAIQYCLLNARVLLPQLKSG